MRLFVAVEFPPLLKEELARWTAALVRHIPDPHKRLHWVKPDQFHLTLKFLGETPAERLYPLETELRRHATLEKPFSIMFGKVGHFGGRVVWLGAQAGAAEAAALARRVDSACQAVGWEAEKRSYQAHVTLARAKTNPGNLRLMTLEQKLREQTFGPLTVSEFVIYQSRLHPNGAIYEVISRFPLKG